MNPEIMRQAGFGVEVDRIEAGLCAWCGEDMDRVTWRDELSVREAKISGLCQACQDKVFQEDSPDA